MASKLQKGVVSYFKKYEECINKIKISFANDVDFLPFIESYKKEGKIVKMKLTLYKIFRWCTESEERMAYLMLGIFVLIGLLAILKKIF